MTIPMPPGRRTILRAGLRTGLLGGAMAAGARWRPARAQTPVTLTFAVWAAQAELDAFNAVIERFQAQNPGISVKLVVNGSGQHLQIIDTQLAGRQAPDLFRVQYQQLGRYAGSRAVIDLTKYLDPGAMDAFAPAFARAVTFKGRVYALPHHTDTFAVYVNRDMLAKTGAQLPAKLEESWSWADFMALARAMKEKAGAPYGFAMSWQNAAYRWLPFLYQHGGQMLNADLSRSQLSDPKGMETLAWCQSWFKEGLVPPSTSVKSSEQPQNLFANGTVGMLLGGDWQIPFLSKTMAAPWQVTFMPRDAAMASDLGGNAVAVSRDCKNPEAAAAFLKFLTDERDMEEFVVSAQFLPVRRALAAHPLAYKLHPEAMEVFVTQAGTIPEHMVQTETLPSFSRINATLLNELDLAFTSGQDPAATARNIDAAVQPLLAA